MIGDACDGRSARAQLFRRRRPARRLRLRFNRHRSLAKAWMTTRQDRTRSTSSFGGRRRCWPQRTARSRRSSRLARSSAGSTRWTPRSVGTSTRTVESSRRHPSPVSARLSRHPSSASTPLSCHQRHCYDGRPVCGSRSDQSCKRQRPSERRRFQSRRRRVRDGCRASSQHLPRLVRMLELSNS